MLTGPIRFLAAVLVAMATLLVTAREASAQRALYTGLLTGHIGVADGGNVRDAGLTLGASVGVVDENGLGAEVDFGYTRAFDDRFSESNLTSFMANFLGGYPGMRFRPFVVAGVGVLRVGVTPTLATPETSNTDWAFNIGGGLIYSFNDIFGVRGDVRYFRSFQEHDDLPLLDAGDFDYWRTSVGLTFAWPMR
jgi:opacity protein-like surface antigen